jgi:hypothetical protein
MPAKKSLLFCLKPQILYIEYKPVLKTHADIRQKREIFFWIKKNPRIVLRSTLIHLLTTFIVICDDNSDRKLKSYVKG